MTARPRIVWDYKHRPSNHDVVTEAGETMIGGKMLGVYYNDTQQKFIVAWDGDFGTIEMEPQVAHYHGRNSECPNVLAGEWTHCEGHEA